MGILSTLTGPKPWEPPHFTMPMATQAADLKSLGRIHASSDEWFAHPKYGEMHAMSVIDEAKQPLPNAVIVDLGDGLWRLLSSPKAPGTFEGLLRGWNSRRQPKPPKPVVPIDGLGHLTFGVPKPQRVYASTVAAAIVTEDQTRGPAGILARLVSAGVTIRPSTDGASLVVETSGGKLVPGLLELIDRAGPFLLAHLRGSPLTCTVTAHKKAAPAVSVTLGGTPVCGLCLDGAS